MDVVTTGSPGEVAVTFSEPVDFIPGGYFSSAFSVNGNPVTSVAGSPAPPGLTANVTVAGGLVSPGDGWAVSFQPDWITQTIDSPQSGVVS